ncbi:DUF4876 domain-containing protein [Chitinophaga lutea]|nr:DUF4876 domain-containing protein [Chitinophaga lutea]
MQQAKLLLFILVMGGLVFTTSCRKDDLTAKNSAVGLTLTNPAGLQNVKTSNIELTFKEINSGISTVIKWQGAGTVLPEGSYDISLDGDVEYKDDNGTYTGKIRGYKQGVVIKGGTVNVEIPLFLYDAAAKFVFKEIFFAGTITPQGKQYNGDKYFIIYNNSEDTLYADGLVIAEAAFLSTTKRVYTPDIMNEAFTAGSIVMIPGTGKQYPVYPGKQIVIANNAINHKEYNTNSFDLTKADFELTLLSSIDVDNPQVTDLINVNSFMTMHNRGFKSYILGRLPEGTTVESFKKDNFYTYAYTNSAGGETKANAYKFPNSWIMDAVNLSVPTVYEWILTSPAVDMGWSYCGKVDSDENRFGKSVKRKVLSTNPDGRVILKDNNNSTLDFEAEAKASLMP